MFINERGPSIKFQQQKERIISLIQSRGPCLPIQIAKGIGVTTIFAGAFLSDLYSEKKIKISSMKVGSSPLYYIEGQEKLLENFTSHLQTREKEALSLLKENSILEDETQTPVVRVALRAIKDFAMPIKIRLNNESKIFWKYFLIEDSEAKELIQEKLSPKETLDIKEKEELTPIAIKPIEKEIERKIEPLAEPLITVKSSQKTERKHEKEIDPLKEELQKKESKKSKEIKPSKKTIKESPFSARVKGYLSEREMEILDILLEKNKEFTCKIRIDTSLGKQEFLLVAKDKKVVNDNDLTIALQNAQTARMPALFISTGDTHKKAKDYLKEWTNLIKFERIKS